MLYQAVIPAQDIFRWIRNCNTEYAIVEYDNVDETLSVYEFKGLFNSGIVSADENAYIGAGRTKGMYFAMGMWNPRKGSPLEISDVKKLYPYVLQGIFRGVDLTEKVQGYTKDWRAKSKYNNHVLPGVKVTAEDE